MCGEHVPKLIKKDWFVLSSYLNMEHIVPKVSWSDVQGASSKLKRLNLEKDEVDSLYHCPIQECEHDGFQSQRGCRKDVSTEHSWFFYFDVRPDSKQVTESLMIGRNEDETSETTKHCVQFLHFHYHVTLVKYSQNG